MFALFRGLTRVGATSLNSFKNVTHSEVRNLCLLPKSLQNSFTLHSNVKSMAPSSSLIAPKFLHMKSGKELVEFLTEEIEAEKKAQKIKAVPTSVDGFNVNLYGADVELVKQVAGEKIVISFNVNHTVDAADDESEVDTGSSQNTELAEMRSKPQFEVDVIKGTTTLSFTCSFLQGAHQEGEYNDAFAIDEVCIFEGEWNNKVYAVSGDVLDGYLYDLLMNLLEEKGISNEFAEKLADLSTAYEHASYIGFLESLSKFNATTAK